MFNAQNSAYGRGITANLVSEEQRIRYNSGGRVAYGLGDTVLKYGYKIPGVKKLLTKIPGADKLTGKSGSINPYAWLSGKAPILPKTPSLTGKGYFGSTKYGTTEVPLAKSFYGKGAGLLTGLKKKIQKSPTAWGTGAAGTGWLATKLFGGKKEIDTSDAGGPSKFKDTFKFTKKPTEVDPDSDTLDWTDQEKKEKIGQIQLKMAQRLVGGARDKWGSKAQMKNIGDWFGDVASIGDKAELRKDERKYKAMGKAYKDIAQSAYDRQNNYMGMINAGSDHPTALARTTGVTGALTVSGDPDQRKDQVEKITARGPGTIYFDEVSNTWNILTPDGSVKVTVDQIQEAVKSGKIDKMREKPDTKAAKTPKVIEEDEDIVTQAGTKGVIPFDPEDPDFQVMLN